jgi:phage gp29-like protein
VVQRKPERFGFDAEGRLKHRDSDGTMVDLYSQAYKWLVWRHDKDPENPYGTSVLKACYWAWKFKKAGLEFWLMATEKFAVPSILALFDASGDEETIRQRAENLAKMLNGVSSGSGAALANVKSATVISADGKLSEFKALTDWCDTQFAYAIVYSSLAVQEAENGTRAQAEVHADTFLAATKEICRDLEEVLQQVVDWIVELNFGPGEMAPKVAFDLAEYASWAVIKDAIDSGLPISLSALYDRYGIPKPTDDGDSFLRAPSSPLSNFSDDEKKKSSRIRILNRRP